jgi:hypothetical protein
METAYIIYDGLATQIREGIARGGAPGQVAGLAARTGFRFALDHRPVFKLVQRSLMESDTWRSERGDRSMLPFILSAARALGRDEAALGAVALDIRSMIFLVARYATADLRELAYVLSAGKSDQMPDDEVERAVEEHLAAVAARLFATAATSG